jgi:hypothetical protein
MKTDAATKQIAAPPEKKNDSPTAQSGADLSRMVNGFGSVSDKTSRVSDVQGCEVSDGAMMFFLKDPFVLALMY